MLMLTPIFLSRLSSKMRLESHRNFPALGEGLAVNGKCLQGNVQDPLFWVSHPYSDDIKVMHHGNSL